MEYFNIHIYIYIYIYINNTNKQYKTYCLHKYYITRSIRLLSIVDISNDA